MAESEGAYAHIKSLENDVSSIKTVLSDIRDLLIARYDPDKRPYDGDKVMILSGVNGIRRALLDIRDHLIVDKSSIDKRAEREIEHNADNFVSRYDMDPEHAERLAVGLKVLGDQCKEAEKNFKETEKSIKGVQEQLGYCSETKNV